MLAPQLTANVYKTIHRLARVTGVRRWPLVPGRTVGGVLGPIVRRIVALSRADRPAVVRGHRMLLSPVCDLSAWFVTDDFEQGTTALFERCLREGMVVVDGGAYVGYYTLLAARRVGKSGRVYAFEPQSDNYTLLAKNVELNGYRNVVPVKKALGARSGTAALHLRGSAQHSLYPPAFASGGSESVEVITLDEFLESQGWPQVDLIKLDLEGGEPDAIEGMHGLLERSPQVRLVLEFAPQRLNRAGANAAAFLQRLQSFGFDLAVIDDSSGLLQPLEAARVLSTLREEDSYVNILGQRQEQGDAP